MAWFLSASLLWQLQAHFHMLRAQKSQNLLSQPSVLHDNITTFN